MIIYDMFNADIRGLEKKPKNLITHQKVLITTKLCRFRHVLNVIFRMKEWQFVAVVQPKYFDDPALEGFPVTELGMCKLAGAAQFRSVSIAGK